MTAIAPGNRVVWGLATAALFVTLAVGYWIGTSSDARGDSIKLNWASFTIDGYTDAGESYCSAFKISEADVEQYFKAMKSAPDRHYAEDLYSPCKMNGKIKLRNGDEGTYVIQSSGVGSITTGKDQARTVFSEPTWKDPNEGGYFNKG